MALEIIGDGDTFMRCIVIHRLHLFYLDLSLPFHLALFGNRSCSPAIWKFPYQFAANSTLRRNFRVALLSAAWPIFNPRASSHSATRPFPILAFAAGYTLSLNPRSTSYAGWHLRMPQLLSGDSLSTMRASIFASGMASTLDCRPGWGFFSYPMMAQIPCLYPLPEAQTRYRFEVRVMCYDYRAGLQRVGGYPYVVDRQGCPGSLEFEFHLSEHLCGFSCGI